MADDAHETVPPEPPEAVVVGRRWRLPPGLVWAVPIVALLIAGWLGIQAIRSRGPTITVSFRAARWLEARKTKVKYRDVDVGEVRSIGFSADRSTVIVTAEVTPDTEPWLVDDTRFWIVEPHITAAQVSGLETLLSGAYIALDVGTSKQGRRHFAGLDAPPVVTGDTPGRPFLARAERGIRVGSPIFFHHLEVGQVTSSDLDGDGRHVAVHMFVRAPYDRFVTTATRFWDASGIRGGIGANGVHLEADSLVTVLLGGIDFDAGPDGTQAPPAPPDRVFKLFSSAEEAMKEPEGPWEDHRLVFHQSVRGLGVGAPVDFRGIPLGEVTRIGVDYDPGRVEFATVVDVRIYPRRLVALDERPEPVETHVEHLIAGGLRAQLRIANFLTGQLFVALDLFPRAPRVDPARNPQEIPTIPSGLEDLRASLTTFARKVGRFPVDEVGRVVDDLRRVLGKAGLTIEHADSFVSQFGPTSPGRADLDDAVRQVARAARSLRALADSLERHPESLIRGRK